MLPVLQKMQTRRGWILTNLFFSQQSLADFRLATSKKTLQYYRFFAHPYLCSPSHVCIRSFDSRNALSQHIIRISIKEETLQPMVSPFPQAEVPLFTQNSFCIISVTSLSHNWQQRPWSQLRNAKERSFCPRFLSGTQFLDPVLC